MITVSFRQCGDEGMQMFLSGCSQMRCHYPGLVSDLLFSAHLLNWVTEAPGCKPELCECCLLMSPHNWGCRTPEQTPGKLGRLETQTTTFPAEITLKLHSRWMTPLRGACFQHTKWDCSLNNNAEATTKLLPVLILEDAMLNLHS